MDEDELMDGEEGEEYSETDRNRFWDGGHTEHKETHRRKQSKQPRHQLVWRDDEDDGWDDDEHYNEDEGGAAEWQDGDEEADEENTDSSISDPDDFSNQQAVLARRRAPPTYHQDFNDGDHLRHRGAAGRGTVVTPRRQSHYPSGSSVVPATVHGRRSSVLMADVARLAAAARQQHGGTVHGHHAH